MANRSTNVANAYETTLSASMGPEDLTMSVVEVSGAPAAPCFLVVDPLDSEKREYIFFDGTGTATSFSTSSLDNRYLAGSAALGSITHDAGAVVRMSPLMQHIDDLNDRIDTRLSSSQHTKAIHDSMGIAHSSLSGLASGDPHTQYLTNGRHSSIAHEDKLTISPTGKRMTVGTSPHANPSVHDLWVDTN